jgi:hypothetical protein
MKRMVLTPASLFMLCATFANIANIAHAQHDTLVYQVTNGYNREVVGRVRKMPAPSGNEGGHALHLCVDSAALGVERVEIIDAQGRWLRRTLDSHGVPIDYAFSPALPARRDDMRVGHSWSQRVNATVTLAGESVRRSVRVDAKVISSERLRVPAGEFDTLSIHRIIYAGDGELTRAETRIDERVWYAPALRRSARIDTRSSWLQSGCRRHCEYRGDWFIHELVQAADTEKQEHAILCD